MELTSGSNTLEATTTSEEFNFGLISNDPYNYGTRNGLREAVLFIYKKFSPVILACGLLGNLLALIVVQQKVFRGTNFSLLISALAVADSAVLVTELLQKELASFFRIIKLEHVSCESVSFAVNFCRHFAPCIVVLVTVERTISVLMPLRCKQICTKRSILVAITCILVLVLGWNMHIFFTSSTDIKKFTIMGTTIKSVVCLQVPKYLRFTRSVWPFLDGALSSVLPALVILICNTIMAVKLIKLHRMRAVNLGTDRKKKSSSVTTTLVTVSITFLVLTLPRSMQSIHHGMEVWSFNDYQDIATSSTMTTIFSLMYSANNSINFLLYCISGTKFRSVFIQLITPRCCKTSKKEDEGSTRKTMSTITT